MIESPLELKILEAIQTRLLTIDAFDPYHLDFKTDNRVFIWETNVQADEGIALVIYSGRSVNQSDTDNPNVRRTVWSMPVMIRGFLRNADDQSITPFTAFQCIADIKTAIRNGGTQPPFLPEQWPDADGNKLAMFTKDVAHGIEREPDSFEITGVNVELEVIYISQKFNSYE